MRMRLSFLSVLVFGWAVFLPSCKGPLATASPDLYGEDIEFIVLQLNDVYEIAPLDGGKVGGLARVSELRKQLLTANPNLITILDGDYLNPSLIGSLKCNFVTAAGDTFPDRINGRQMVETMNDLGVDYVTFGNHEFDLNEKDLQARNDESQFRIISSNVLNQVVRNGDTLQVPFRQNGRDVPSWLVHTFKSPRGTPLRVGLIGLTLNSNPQPFVAYLDPQTEARKAIDAAQKESDIVLGITHLTMAEDVDLAGKITDMPLIFGGHEHVNMSRTVGGTSIWKADANAKTVYIHWCRYNTQSKKLTSYSQLMPITNLLPEDPKVTETVSYWNDFANACMEQQGYLPNDTIYNALVPLEGRDEYTRYGPTNLGRIIADAMLKVEVGAELAFFNSGSIRLDDQITGYVLQKSILGTLPFGGGIKQGVMRGDSLRKFLDAGLAETIKGNGAYQQLSSNIRVTSPGNYLINGAALEGARNYSVAAPSFLTDGGEPALTFLKNMADWKDPDIVDASDAPKNDIRDITIWYMKGIYKEQ